MDLETLCHTKKFWPKFYLGPPFGSTHVCKRMPDFRRETTQNGNSARANRFSALDLPMDDTTWYCRTPHYTECSGADRRTDRHKFCLLIFLVYLTSCLVGEKRFHRFWITSRRKGRWFEDIWGRFATKKFWPKILPWSPLWFNTCVQANARFPPPDPTKWKFCLRQSTQRPRFAYGWHHMLLSNSTFYGVFGSGQTDRTFASSFF